MDQSKIIDRIKKLLSMAEDTSSPNEAAIAAERATKLLQKHNIDRASILINTMTEDNLTERRSDLARKTMPTWISNLIVPVAKLHDCEARYAFFEGKTAVEFLGEEEDVVVAQYVFDYLITQIKLLTNKYAKSGNDRSSVRQFRAGCSSAIYGMVHRMMRDKAEAERQHSDSKGLVVRKQELITKKYNVTYRKGSTRSREITSSYADGIRAGSKVSIRSGIGADSRTGIEG